MRLQWENSVQQVVNAAETGWDSACFLLWTNELTRDFICLGGCQPPTIKQGESHFCCSNHFFKRLTSHSPFVKPLSWCWNHSCWHSDFNSELLLFHVWWSTPQKLLCFIEKSLLRGNTGLMDSIKEYLSPSTTLFRLSTTTTGAGREGFDQLEDLDWSSKTMEKHNQEILHGIAVGTNGVNDKASNFGGPNSETIPIECSERQDGCT